jgi:hypothetical protein
MQQDKWHSIRLVRKQGNKMNIVLDAIINDRSNVVGKRINMLFVLSPVSIVAYISKDTLVCDGQQLPVKLFLPYTLGLPNPLICQPIFPVFVRALICVRSKLRMMQKGLELIKFRLRD